MYSKFEQLAVIIPDIYFFNSFFAFICKQHGDDDDDDNNSIGRHFPLAYRMNSVFATVSGCMGVNYAFFLASIQSNCYRLLKGATTHSITG